MKRTVKIIAMLLSAIMLIAAFAACAKPDNNGDTTTTDAPLQTPPRLHRERYRTICPNLSRSTTV